LRCLPNFTLMAPADENECRQMLYTGFMLNGPAAVRYPRGSGPGVAVEPEMRALDIGKAEVRRRGSRVALLAFGAMVTPALEVGEKLDLTVVNMRFIKPLDVELLRDLASSYELLVTIEENVVAGGAGSAVNETLVELGLSVPCANYGLPDRLIQHGSREDMLNDAGLTAAAFERFVAARIGVLDSSVPAARRA
jgi:1-deoxy-D-xylulose-5-phosphate synthase